ncbi:prophage lambdaBa02 DNA replication protein [Allorhizobium ampelinum S4]|uniref:Prophage lambdaBa02 DNA replication protein n=2 Tax=Rhizobium/Agrobacterium group TaxID=227290 RepID=B9JSB1_ALLAM|nr:helix-turn-helix domain-containing protein [Agrobacterium vitis]ACM35604.1 prophage lambdaBa02 DNA replication protein [Allorhizobium ampelinum S4]
MTWLDQVYSDERLSKSVATNVAFFISQHFNRKRFNESGDFSAWPSYATLAEKVGCSEKTVQRAVSLLKQCGHIHTKGKGGRHCSLAYYAVLVSQSAQNVEEKGGHRSPRLKDKADFEAEKVDTAVPKGGHSRPQKVDTDVLLTSLNKSLKNLSEAPTAKPERKAPAEVSGVDPLKAAGSVAVLSVLMTGPGELPPLPPFVRQNPKHEWVMDHQAKHGWPDLYSVCRDPQRWYRAFDDFAHEMEAVEASKDNPKWCAWRDEYRARGWPMPRPDGQLMHFPDCGPKLLDVFLVRLLRAMQAVNIARSANVVRFG